jgi:uncharacterized protein YndB with AHSA1/START domain
VTANLTLDPVFKSVVVSTDATRAFEIFTKRIDRWWPAAYRVGAGCAITAMVVEQHVGGRWYARLEDGSEHEIARILVWEPPHRIVFAWEMTAQWKRDPALTTEVEIRFVPEGLAATRLELEHRGFERHGHVNGATLRNRMNGGWPSILDAFASEIQTPPP